jgi:hypothetical protein
MTAALFSKNNTFVAIVPASFQPETYTYVQLDKIE